MKAVYDKTTGLVRAVCYDDQDVTHFTEKYPNTDWVSCDIELDGSRARAGWNYYVNLETKEVYKKQLGAVRITQS